MRFDARHTSTAAVALLAALFLAPHVALAQSQDGANASILNVKNLDLSFAPTSATSDDTATSPSPSPMRAKANGVGIGIKGGPLFSTFHDSVGSGGLQFSQRTGFMGGLFIGGNRPGVVGVATELNIVQHRAKNPDGSTTNLYSFQIPIFARINIGSSSTNGVNFYVLVGPAFDINFKANNNLGGVVTDIKDQTENFDVSFVGGAGVEITRFIIEGRYIQGFRNIAKNLTGSEKITTRGVAILFGVRFN
jgi:hypothetical protein